MTDNNDNTIVKKKSLFRKLTSSMISVKSKKALVDSINNATQNNVIDTTSQNMLIGAMKISSLDVGDIMITHTKINAVNLSMNIKEFLEATILSTHTRLPVYNKDKTEILGIIHAKDLLRLIFDIEINGFKDAEINSSDIKKMLRPAVFIPETKKLSAMLKDFKNSQNHMAIVVDEYGAVCGLITIEDILEEIVGEIEDEFDTINENIVKLSDDVYCIDATTTIDDFNEYFDTSINDEADYDTVAGMIIQTLEYLPQKGESIVVDGYKFIVDDADNRKITKIIIERFGKS